MCEVLVLHLCLGGKSDFKMYKCYYVRVCIGLSWLSVSPLAGLYVRGNEISCSMKGREIF
jgi:hypothetical protein